MSKFFTEKEIEARLIEETRYLPIPEPLKTSDGRIVTIYKKKPVTMMKELWNTYDTLTEEPNPIYTENELLLMAAKTIIEVKSDLNDSLHNVVAHAYNSYRETNLPILNEIDELTRELEALEKKDNDNSE